MKTPSPKTVFRVTAFLSLCFFVLANLCAGKAAAYFGLTLDFTGERLYSLSGVTKDAVSQLQSPTAIHVISDKASPVLGEIISRYAKLSPAINIRYVDPYADPVFLDHYSRQGYQIKESDILVEGAHGLRHIPSAEIFGYDSTGNPGSLNLEEKLTNAVVFVNTGREFSASFTVGHGEQADTPLAEALKGGGFSVNSLALVTGAAPSSDIVVIAGPERDFLPEEIAALDAYLADGGTLMAFIGPVSARLPELENFLSAWTLSLLPGLVMEPLAHSSGNPSSVIPLYGMHEINMDFAERQYYLAMPGACAVGLAGDTAGIAVTRLLLSSRDAYSKTGMNNTSSAKSPDDPGGPFVLAAAAEKSDGKGAVILFGSTGIYSPDIIAAPAFANREYLVNAALRFAGGDAQNAISIPPKNLAPPPVNAGFAVTLAVLLIFGVTLPLAALTSGIVILYRRRRR